MLKKYYQTFAEVSVSEVQGLQGTQTSKFYFLLMIYFMSIFGLRSHSYKVDTMQLKCMYFICMCMALLCFPSVIMWK